jgi:hypothetical protein
MASTSETGSSGLGILQPNLKHRFQVSFLNEDGELLSMSEGLTRQVIAVSPFTQTSDDGTAQPTSVVIKIEEDLTNVASKSIQELLQVEDFTLRLETLDGNAQVTKTVCIKGAWLNNIMHSELDYGAAVRNNVALDLFIPSTFGTLIDTLCEESPVAKMIHTVLSHSNFRLTMSPDEQNPMTVVTLLEIGYNSSNVEVTFCN